MITSIGWVKLSRERDGRNLIGGKCPRCEQIELRPRAKCRSCGELLTTMGEIKGRERFMNVRFDRNEKVFSINGIKIEDRPIEVRGTVFNRMEVKSASLDFDRVDEKIGRGDKI